MAYQNVVKSYIKVLVWHHSLHRMKCDGFVTVHVVANSYHRNEYDASWFSYSNHAFVV